MKIYCLAEDRLEKLFRKDDDSASYDEVFAFDRTVSRLQEMQTDYYFKKPHQYVKEI